MRVSAHKDAVSLFERYAKGGEDPKLKDWAGKTLPALKHHLEMAQALDKIRNQTPQTCRDDPAGRQMAIRQPQSPEGLTG